MPSSKRELQGSTPRPSPLKVSKDSFKAKKPAQSDLCSPVIVHMHSPMVIHSRPQDFMRVVQLLTGQSSAVCSSVQPLEKAQASPNNLVREFKFY